MRVSGTEEFTPRVGFGAVERVAGGVKIWIRAWLKACHRSSKFGAGFSLWFLSVTAQRLKPFFNLRCKRHRSSDALIQIFLNQHYPHGWRKAVFPRARIKAEFSWNAARNRKFDETARSGQRNSPLAG